MKACVF